MTFIFPANSKNSTSAVCHLYTKMSRFVFVVNVIFRLFSEGYILELDKGNKTKGKLAFAVRHA